MDTFELNLNIFRGQVDLSVNVTNVNMERVSVNAIVNGCISIPMLKQTILQKLPSEYREHDDVHMVLSIQKR